MTYFSLLPIMWEEAPESKVQGFWGWAVYVCLLEEDA